MNSKQRLSICNHSSPFGWKVENGKEVPDQNEQNIIDMVRDYRAICLSYKHIARALTRDPFTTKFGFSKFSVYDVKRINDAETPEERGKKE